MHIWHSLVVGSQMASMERATEKLTERAPLWQRIVVPLFALYFVLGHMMFLDGLFKGTGEYFQPATMTETQQWITDLFPFFTNFGLALSPFIRNPRPVLRYAMVLSLACGAILTGFRLVPGVIGSVQYVISGEAANAIKILGFWSYLDRWELWATMTLYIYVSTRKLFRLVIAG